MNCPARKAAPLGDAVPDQTPGSSLEDKERASDWVKAAVNACQGFPLETLEAIPAGQLYAIYLVHLSLPTASRARSQGGGK